jgi:hypothetical protein
MKYSMATELENVHFSQQVKMQEKRTLIVLLLVVSYSTAAGQLCCLTQRQNTPQDSYQLSVAVNSSLISRSGQVVTQTRYTLWEIHVVSLKDTHMARRTHEGNRTHD